MSCNRRINDSPEPRLPARLLAMLMMGIMPRGLPTIRPRKRNRCPPKEPNIAPGQLVEKRTPTAFALDFGDGAPDRIEARSLCAAVQAIEARIGRRLTPVGRNAVAKSLRPIEWKADTKVAA